MTSAPRKREPSYRDPDLSDRWLWEARARVEGRGPRLGMGDAKKIILRLLDEIERVNRETGR